MNNKRTEKIQEEPKTGAAKKSAQPAESKSAASATTKKTDKKQAE